MLLGEFDVLGMNKIWIEQGKSPISDAEIAIGQRIGVDYAGEDALRPYRFTWEKK